MLIKLLSEKAMIPERATSGSAGFDLYVPKDFIIKPGRNVVPLDFAIAIPPSHEAHIRPRSGFSSKGMEGVKVKGAGAYGSPVERFDADVLQGTIDQDYRGNVGVIVKSFEKDPFMILGGTRIAQMVISKCLIDDFESVDNLESTNRGDGGFGSTGTH